MKKRPLILVVDDEEPLRKLLRVNLSLEGYDIIMASNGKSSLKKFQKYQPDMIILDIMMPGLDGFRILQSIREHSITVPVIILTARSDANSLKSSLLSGADYFMTKPFSLEDLLALVKTRLKRKEKELYEIDSNE